MNKLALPGWEPHFARQSPLFAPLAHLAAYFEQYAEWPGLVEMQALLDQWPHPVTTLSGQNIKVVAQDDRPNCFAEHYAPRIYLTGEIQTRAENWHDFFQYLTWFMFPETKAVINSIHIPHARKRIEEGGELGSRTPVENMLSLFDEGGAVLISSDESMLQQVRDFEWKQLFWQRREEMAKKFACVPFGHAVYEKGLAPYIGMTANCILLKSDEAFFVMNNDQQLAWIDQQLAALLREGTTLQKPKDLNPFPILGMPGWDADNGQESYYDNTNYFRPGRGRKAA
jgi:hypothetical protein